MHARGTDQSASLAVVEAVAHAEAVDPTDLPPLHETIDPDALDAIFSTDPPGDPAEAVSFSYCGHRVTIFADGAVTLEG